MKFRTVLGLWLSAVSSVAFAQQVLVEESFTQTTAPGFILLGDAALTANSIDSPGNGWLRLTPNLQGQAGGAIYDVAFDSTSGIQVTFEYATWGAGSDGDGLSFFLIDGATASPTLGGGGGSLGYAGSSDGTVAGVSNGYLGLGLDEFGNYASTGTGSCNEIPCNAGAVAGVGVRGSGDTSDPNAFNLLSFDTFSIPTGSRAGARPVRLTITPAPAVTLTVEIDSGAGFQTVVNGLDITSANFPTQAPIPATFKLGFGAATGAATNNHEIRNLRVTQAGLTVTPSPLDFGDVAVGSSSGTQSVLVENTSVFDIQVNGVTAAAGAFSRVGGSCPGSTPFAITANSSCTIDYQFAPAATGMVSQTLTINSDAPSSPDQYDLVGNGVVPALTVTPDPQDFGDQVVGTTSAGASVTLTNSGSGDLDVSSLSAASAPFANAGGSCGSTPFTIGAGASCTVDYTFSPSATGAASQSISVASNAPSSPDAFELRGNGTQAGLAIAPNPQDFGDQVVGTTSAAASVTLSNSGSADLDVSAVDAASAPFAVAGGSCGSAPFTINAGASCTIDYTFAPTATGSASQSISVSSNAPSSPDAFELRGNGTQAGLAIAPNPQDFGDQEVGTTSAAASVTLTNSGSADLDVSSVSAAAAPFADAGGSCGSAPFTITAGASCTLDYTFSPTATGAASQSISVASNAPSSPDSFSLEGNGTEAVVSIDTGSVSLQVDFGGTASATVNVTNSGSADLTISDIADLAFPFSFDGGSCFAVPTTLAAGESCSIDVLFDPGTVSGSFLDSFDIDSNAASSPDTVTVQGTAGDAVAIPTLDRTGLLLLALLMLSIGGLVVRRVA